MNISDELLEYNGYEKQIGIPFPFNVANLYIHPKTKVYIVNATIQDNSGKDIWLWGIGDDHLNDGEGTSVEQFNIFLKNHNINTLKNN